ncbi:FAD-dependent monooxygenase [Salinactinospora qingdaonensis]|uniref:FAD-dependent monooxygenase n=1 Tax=Salinactinospora qingdaonensis TaxID=702744 RepID=A0ABP7FFW1_9ACTN
MQRTQVLIVGAGPTGLALAAQLHRLGVACRIIDKHAQVLELTKSAALHSRTLEYFRDLGVVDRIVAEGQRVDILDLRTGHRDRVTVDFRTLGDAAYPYMIDIPQARTEHILIDHLTDVGVELERGVTCTGIKQTGDGVAATVTLPDDSTDTIHADWLVGCDGAHSTIRSLLGLDFVGDAYADDWVLCDGVVDWPLPRNEMTFSSDSDGIYGVFPLPGDRRYRLAYTQNRDANGELVEPDIEDAQRAMARTGIEGTIHSVDQFWTFNLAHRQATSYRKGRAFLVGDAAHVHTPFGGQGLNLGVGDAMNLGWKLAAVANGRAPVDLLDTYEEERHRVGKQVVSFTHLGAQAMLLRGDPRRHLRDAVMGVLQSSPAALRQMARRLSQVAHSYRNTSTVTGRVRKLRGGDRLPDYSLFDGVANHNRRLHDLLPSDRPALLLTGQGNVGALLSSARQMLDALRTSHPNTLAMQVLTTDWKMSTTAPEDIPVVLDRGREADELYGPHPTAYLVRPDRHLCYVGPPAVERIREQLAMMFTAETGAYHGAHEASASATEGRRR